MLAQRIGEIQSALAESELDGWLFAVFQGNDPVSLELLGLASKGMVTRRCYYLVPAAGTPRKLVHDLEPAMLDHLPGERAGYRTWQEHRRELEHLLRDCKRLAAQYSPNNELPNVSRLDAGTAELLTSFGVKLHSAADLVQQFAAVWSPDQLESHRRANTRLHEIVKASFDFTAERLRSGTAIDELDIQKFILDAFERDGLHTFAPPIVGVNAHAADPHYEPVAGAVFPVRRGDFLLVDLWAKEKASADSIYGDITWCAVCGAAPTDKQQEVWTVVRDARDAGVDLVLSRWPSTGIRGYEVDDATRKVIVDAGYGDYFIHRTGHSIGIQDHGQGANMDNLETHDTRRLLAMTGFSIEPGIYLPGDFGVRSEVNIALTAGSAEVTGGEPQRELVRLLA
jgi:Xaa-Pro dipeptidase